MRGFLGAVTVYPTVLFTFALIVVAGYWLLVLLGGAHVHGARGGHAGHAGGHGHGHAGAQGHAGGHGHDRTGGRGPGAAHGHEAPGRTGGHGHGSGGGRHGHAVPWRVLGLGGMPITVAVSLVVAFAWFTALAGRAWLGGAPWYLVPVALAGGWLGARLLARPLRRLTPEPAVPPSRRDFVGLGCVIRTGRVGPDFGQAEVRAADGSSAVVQVRQRAGDAAEPGGSLGAGAPALIYDYDAEGEFFWVMPAPPASG